MTKTTTALLWLWLVAWFALAAFAEDETVIPDTDVNGLIGANVISVSSDVCGSACANGVECSNNIDEDPESAEDDLLITGTVDAEVYVVDMTDPSDTISVDTDAQRINYVLSDLNMTTDCEEGDHATNPNYQIDLYCNGSYIKNIRPAAAIQGGGPDQSLYNDWTFPSSGCANDGSDVQFGLVINYAKVKTNAYGTGYESIEWEVTWGEPPSGRGAMVISDADTKALTEYEREMVEDVLALWNEE